MRAQFGASTRFDCTSRLGEIRAPTLIVHGRSDRAAPVAFAEEIRRAIPGVHRGCDGVPDGGRQLAGI
jgi:pimeloyl-ACP methyl ester carboxylesterase